MREALRDAAVRAGLVDLRLIRLVDASSVAIDDEGVVLGADEAIDALRERMPAWFLDEPLKFMPS